MINLKIKTILFSIYIEIFILIILIKSYYINKILIQQDSTFYYRFFQSIFHDSFIYFLILLLIFISFLGIIPKFFSMLLRFIALNITFLYLIDIYILLSFYNHLTINDILKYYNYAINFLFQIYTINFYTMILIFFIVLFSSIFIFNSYKIKSKKTYLKFIIPILLLLFLYSFAKDGKYIHSWLNKNFIEYNIEINDQTKEYTKEFIKNIQDPENLIYKNSSPSYPNIIVLMVESLASYQSQYFSGIKNWTPNLDKIAKDNISFLNFFANGFVTEDAEVSINTGEFPLYAPKAYTNGGGVSFTGFYNMEESLPNILKRFNYHTEFITSSDLHFSNTGEWAKSNGFEYIEGSENSYYTNKQRFHFNAAADEFLYDRVIDRVKKQNKQYYLFIKTVSSHAPFRNPENNSSSEEETIKYIDKQIGIFYKKLKQNSFFDDGLLIIVGDHHPVIPIRNEELDRFGELKSSSIVPMVVAYKNKNFSVKENFQQVDIYNSIKNLVSKISSTSKWKGDFLSEKMVTPKYIVHRRGDKRGIVSIFTEKDEFNIKFYGDETHILDNSIYPEVIEKINFTRIKRLNPKYQFIDSK
ncbi:LTA synthase family protein [Campylobacterota bacterium DY0563]